MNLRKDIVRLLTIMRKKFDKLNILIKNYLGINIFTTSNVECIERQVIYSYTCAKLIRILLKE